MSVKNPSRATREQSTREMTDLCPSKIKKNRSRKKEFYGENRKAGGYNWFEDFC